MILVDTSVWVAHLQRSHAGLVSLLEDAQVVTHSCVIGELALGNLRQRAVLLDALTNLPRVVEAADAEVLTFIGAKALHGTGIGYVDAQLLAATTLTRGASLWTLDKRLAAVAARLGVAAEPRP